MSRSKAIKKRSLEPEIVGDELGPREVVAWEFHAPTLSLGSSNLTVTPDSRAPIDVLVRGLHIRAGFHLVPGMASTLAIPVGGPPELPSPERRELVGKSDGLTAAELEAWKERRELPARRVRFAPDSGSLYRDALEAMDRNPHLAHGVAADWEQWSEAVRGKGGAIADALGALTRWTPLRVLEPMTHRDGGTVEVGASGLFVGITSAAEVIVELPVWTGKGAARACRWRLVRCPPSKVQAYSAEDLCPGCDGKGGSSFTNCQNCGGSGLRSTKGELCPPKKNKPRKSRNSREPSRQRSVPCLPPRKPSE